MFPGCLLVLFPSAAQLQYAELELDSLNTHATLALIIHARAILRLLGQRLAALIPRLHFKNTR